MRSLAGRVAIVTGASSGIGRATALLFAAEGASVALAARRRDVLGEVVLEVERARGRAVALAGDVGDEDYAKALVTLAVEKFGR